MWVWSRAFVVAYKYGTINQYINNGWGPKIKKFKVKTRHAINGEMKRHFCFNEFDVRAFIVLGFFFSYTNNSFIFYIIYIYIYEKN